MQEKNQTLPLNEGELIVGSIVTQGKIYLVTSSGRIAHLFPRSGEAMGYTFASLKNHEVIKAERTMTLNGRMVKDFVDDHVIVTSDTTVPKERFYAAFESWCHAKDRRPVSRIALWRYIKQNVSYAENHKEGIRYVNLEVVQDKNNPQPIANLL